MQIKGIMKRSLLIGFLETRYSNIIFGHCIPLKNSEINTLHHFKPQACVSVNTSGTNQSCQPRRRFPTQGFGLCCLLQRGPPWRNQWAEKDAQLHLPLLPPQPSPSLAKWGITQCFSPVPAETPEWGALTSRRVNAVPCKWSMQKGLRLCISAPAKPFFWLSVFTFAIAVLVFWGTSGSQSSPC